MDGQTSAIALPPPPPSAHRDSGRNNKSSRTCVPGGTNSKVMINTSGGAIKAGDNGRAGRSECARWRRRPPASKREEIFFSRGERRLFAYPCQFPSKKERLEKFVSSTVALAHIRCQLDCSTNVYGNYNCFGPSSHTATSASYIIQRRSPRSEDAFEIRREGRLPPSEPSITLPSKFTARHQVSGIPGLWGNDAKGKLAIIAGDFQKKKLATMHK